MLVSAARLTNPPDMNTTTVAVSLLGLAALIGFVLFSSLRLEAQDAAYRAYEECVEREFGRSPSAYYQEHGGYPKCR
jgi:hypothetical protein